MVGSNDRLHLRITSIDGVDNGLEYVCGILDVSTDLSNSTNSCIQTSGIRLDVGVDLSDTCNCSMDTIHYALGIRVKLSNTVDSCKQGLQGRLDA